MCYGTGRRGGEGVGEGGGCREGRKESEEQDAKATPVEGNSWCFDFCLVTEEAAAAAAAAVVVVVVVVVVVQEERA